MEMYRLLGKPVAWVVLFALAASACKFTDVVDNVAPSPVDTGSDSLPTVTVNATDSTPDSTPSGQSEDKTVSVGTVESISEGTWTIGGQIVVIDSQTEVDDAVSVGSFVKIKTQVAADGSLIVREIELLEGSGLDANASDDDDDDDRDDDDDDDDRDDDGVDDDRDDHDDNDDRDDDDDDNRDDDDDDDDRNDDDDDDDRDDDDADAADDDNDD